MTDITAEATKVVKFYVARDTDNEQARDEDRAMAHASIATTDTLDEAREALIDYMRGEVTYLSTGRYLSGRSLRRAADIFDATGKVLTLTPAEGQSWSQASVVAAGLVWSITRTER